MRVLALSNRFGQQMALVAGLDHCDADAVVMMDGDLQHPPAVIPALVAQHERGFDVVYTVREDIPDVPWFKRVSARLFYRLLNRFSETPVHEGAADFRLVSRRVVEVFQTRIHERSAFLRGLFSWVGFRSTAVTFRLAPRAFGRTKFPLGRMLEFAADGVVSFSRAPLRAAARERAARRPARPRARRGPAGPLGAAAAPHPARRRCWRCSPSSCAACSSSSSASSASTSAASSTR